RGGASPDPRPKGKWMPLQMIGVSLSGSFPQGVPAIAALLDNVRRVERLGFEAIWSGDHIIMHSPIMDVMTVLASCAAITTRVKIGTAVYLLPLRHPVATAKQVASLDILSGGRFIFGVGVGGEIAREFAAVGVPVSERGRRTDEGLEILTRLLSQEIAPTYGRHPADIQGGMLLFTAIARDHATARQMAIANLSRRYNQPFEPLVDRYCALGTPAQCLEKIQTYIEAGMSNLAFSFTCPADQVTEQIEWCAADLLPHLRPS